MWHINPCLSWLDRPISSTSHIQLFKGIKSLVIHYLPWSKDWVVFQLGKLWMKLLFILVGRDECRMQFSTWLSKHQGVAADCKQISPHLVLVRRNQFAFLKYFQLAFSNQHVQETSCCLLILISYARMPDLRLLLNREYIPCLYYITTLLICTLANVFSPVCGLAYFS